MEETTFEQALEELKSIVQLLEQADRPLTESLGLFERGIGLIKLCTGKLDEVEKKVELLVKNQQGVLETRPFDEPENTE